MSHQAFEKRVGPALQAGAHIVLSGIQLMLAGLGIGLLMAAPIGPVNVLVIQRAAASGFWGGLAAGIGAVLGDGTLAAIAAFSVTAISEVMTAYSGFIQFVGGMLLVAFGIGLLLAKPKLAMPSGASRSCGSTPASSRRPSSSPSPIPARFWAWPP